MTSKPSKRRKQSRALPRGRGAVVVGGAVLLLVVAASLAGLGRNRGGKAVDAASSPTRVIASAERPTASASTGPARSQAATSAVEAPRTVLSSEDGVVRLATADIGAEARFYGYKLSDGKTIAFFVLRSSDGVIRSAFDACDVCYPAHLGYHQEGDEMVCNNCGSRFSSVLVNEVSGGCNPAPLERSIDGSELVIRAAALESGSRYF